MNNNRITEFFESEEDKDARVSLSHTASNFLTEDFLTLTLGQDDKFRVFFDEDAYKSVVSELDKKVGNTTSEDDLAWDIIYFTEQIEQAIMDLGGL
jgi:outer membrane lipoprotein-sorting protein